MSVGTWGPGTGATGTGSHPFCLRIQGVCYIGSVPIESITVTQSVSGNGTLTFTILDTTSALPVPEGWADVEFADRTEQEVIFGGLVMGTTVRLNAAGVRSVEVRCVDYGVLLDVSPLPVELTVTDADYLVHRLAQRISGAAPLGGITALLYTSGGDGRVVGLVDGGHTGEYYQVPIAPGATETVSANQPVRSPLSSYAARVEDVWTAPAIPRPADVYITPLRQLAVRPSTKTFGTAPLEVRHNPSTSTHVAAEDVSLDTDSRQREAGVYVADADTTTGGDNSGYVRGTINGYSVMPGTLSVPLPDDAQRDLEGTIYTAGRAAAVTGRVVVVSVKNFFAGTALTVYYPNAGLDGTYAVHAVTTRFLGGLLRRTEIQFGGELGTVAKFNRTRFARAGVTT